MQKLFQSAHALFHLLRWWWNEAGIAWPSPADPVLTSSEFPRGFVTASPSRHEMGMHFPEQSVA